MSKPAARVGDMHTCPMVTPGTPPVPHVGGPILPPGIPTVLIGGMPAATVGNMCTCVGPPDSIIIGSMTVLIGGKPAARMGDSCAHGGVIAVGFPMVLIGDAGGGGGGSLGSQLSFKIAGDGEKTGILNTKDQKIELFAITEAEYKSDILPALEAAEKLIDQKIKQLETWGKDEKDCFKKAFGDHGKNEDAEKDKKLKQLKKMKELFEELKKGKNEKFKFARFYDKKTNVESKNTFAAVSPPDKGHTVYLSHKYNAAKDTGKDSKAGTLIHELSHFEDVAGTKDEKSKDGKKAYGLTRAKALSEDYPNLAASNADNFEYYIEKTFGC